MQAFFLAEVKLVSLNLAQKNMRFLFDLIIKKKVSPGKLWALAV